MSGCVGFSLQWLLLAAEPELQEHDLQYCSPRARQLWREGLAAPRHVGSSRIGDRTSVLCVARQILNHWATREALFLILKSCFSLSVCWYRCVDVCMFNLLLTLITQRPYNWKPPP